MKQNYNSEVYDLKSLQTDTALHAASLCKLPAVKLIEPFAHMAWKQQ